MALRNQENEIHKEGTSGQRDYIAEAVRLTATSSGLQPYELLVITNYALREQIRAVAWNQAQVTDCSHLLVFAAWDNYTPERINQMSILSTQSAGSLTKAGRRRQQVLDTYLQRDAEITTSTLPVKPISALARPLLRLRCSKLIHPMEGFDPAKVDEILNSIWSAPTPSIRFARSLRAKLISI